MTSDSKLRTLRQALCILGLTGLAAFATAHWHPGAPALYLIQEVTQQDGEISLTDALAAEPDPGVIWVDARTRPAYEKGHVPGAFLVSEHESDFEDLMVPMAMAVQDALSKLVVVYCDGKKCDASKMIAEKIRVFHPEPNQVKVLHGGWDAWLAGGQRTER
jgi:rhodanese-related sulfurtransferase